MTQVSEDRALTVVQRSEIVIAQKDLDMYRQHFCPDAPSDEWEIFKQKCYLLGLNPMLNEVYLVGRNTKTGKDKWVKQFATQVSITGLIALAERTQRYEGHTQAEYYDKDLTPYPVWPLSKGPYPYAIRIGVYKRGWREASYAITYFHERAQYYGDNLSKQWQAQGIHMLYKCALAAALRWAFQETCGGVYIHEEMGTADVEASSITIIPQVDLGSPNTNDALKETASKVQSTPVKATEEKPVFDAKKALDKLYAWTVELGIITDLVGWQQLKCDVFGEMVSDEKITTKEQCEQIRVEIVKRKNTPTMKAG